MFKLIIVLAAFVVADVSANLNFTNCGKSNTIQSIKFFLYIHSLFSGSASQIRAFRLRGCNATPCTFQRGQEYYGEMDVLAG